MLLIITLLQFLYDETLQVLDFIKLMWLEAVQYYYE